MLEFLADAPGTGRQLDWCAVRSLGKQTGVNGWGVGALTAAPATVEDLLDRAFRRRFPVNAHHEWAVARYLSDPASERDAALRRASLADKRQRFGRALRQLGWPEDMISSGDYTPYVLVRVPPAWNQLPDAAEKFRRHLLHHAGILVAHASIEDPRPPGGTGETHWVRFFLGVADDVFSAILGRLGTGAVSYHSEYPGSAGTTTP